MKRIRRIYSPLVISALIECSSTASPVAQTYNSENGEFEPDRTVTPCIIFPHVKASAKDGSWPATQSNYKLANMVWYVDGIDISTISAWSGLYDITTSGNDKGTLSISKNVDISQKYNLHFEADMADTRLGTVLHIVTDSVLLSTISKSEDEYSLHINDDQIIQYNLLKDRLLLYEWKSANGIAVGNRADVIDSNAYERDISISVIKGASPITSGYNLKLYRVSDGAELTAGGDVLSFTLTSLKLDLRLIGKEDYIIKLYINDLIKASKQFSVNRVYPSFHFIVLGGESLLPNDTEILTLLKVSSGGNVIPYPHPFFDILWLTSSFAKEATFNPGVKGKINLADTGIGNTSTDDYIDIKPTIAYRNKFNNAMDDNGNALVDNSGNQLIIN